MREAEPFDEYGLVGEHPIVDLSLLLKRVQQTVCQMHDKKQLLAHLQQVGVVGFTGVGRAQFADEASVVLPDETRLQAAKFILRRGTATSPAPARHRACPDARRHLFAESAAPFRGDHRRGGNRLPVGFHPGCVWRGCAAAGERGGASWTRRTR